ncbi:ribonuclease E activity regulator RraA [Phycicoccus sp. Soil748]|uniref:ribonuclease E activity regulator RraA n=1 Tax=Intrasporangiaceae TaxID=85021 RepID=UPI0007035AF0|nr:ribonuclease E activity regulator RraA [Phycicoccus sp. Soil748]KRE54592.1 ribonuclease [Phycicoccus sp. Soil748]
MSEGAGTHGDATSPATADLYDEHGEDLQSCAVQFRSYGGHRAFHGVISTIRCHRDNALLKARLAEPGEGRVMVVDGGGSLESALMGDLIAGSAVESGWSGVIINGAVRDVVTLRDLPLGALALGSNPRKSSKEGVGERDVTVSFGGVDFVPGQQLWADEDGILVTRA